MANKTSSKFLAGIAGLAMLGAPATASPLELALNENQAAQSPASSSQQFSDLWGGQTFNVRELYSDGIVLSQNIGVTNQDYNLEILYLVKQGSEGRLTQWSVAVSAYSKSDPTKLVTRMRSYGNVESGKFVLKGPELSGDLSTKPYSAVSDLFGHNVLDKILGPADGVQLPAYLVDFGSKFNLLKAGHPGLKSVPQGYDPTLAKAPSSK